MPSFFPSSTQPPYKKGQIFAGRHTDVDRQLRRAGQALAKAYSISISGLWKGILSSDWTALAVGCLRILNNRQCNNNKLYSQCLSYGPFDFRIDCRQGIVDDWNYSQIKTKSIPNSIYTRQPMLHWISKNQYWYWYWWSCKGMMEQGGCLNRWECHHDGVTRWLVLQLPG